MHIKPKDIPTANNEIELCHKHTINDYNKRKYKTVECIGDRRILKEKGKTKRCVIGRYNHQIPIPKQHFQRAFAKYSKK